MIATPCLGLEFIFQHIVNTTYLKDLPANCPCFWARLSMTFLVPERHGTLKCCRAITIRTLHGSVPQSVSTRGSCCKNVDQLS